MNAYVFTYTHTYTHSHIHMHRRRTQPIGGRRPALEEPLANGECSHEEGLAVRAYMDGHGRLKRKLPGRIAPFIYTGIQLVSHRLLRDAPDGKFSTNVLWNRAIEEGRLYGLAFTGHWYEVGTPNHIRPTGK